MGLRNALAEIPEEQLRDVLESRLLGPELRGLELQSYALDHFDDLDSPLVIRAKARIPAFAQRSGDLLLISPPFGPRVSLVLKADIRPGFQGELTAKVERLERAIDRQSAP